MTARRFSRQGARCKSCDTPFVHEIEVDIPVPEYVANLLAVRCPNCGSGELTMGMGLSLSEDRSRRLADGTLEERVNDWLLNGEVGLSSRAVMKFMLEGTRPDSSPRDYDDLRRVILLLDRFPEWRDNMAALAEYDGWKRIGSDWNLIVDAVLTADPEARNPAGAEVTLKGIYE